FSGPIPRGALLRAALLHAGNGAVLDGPTAGSLHGLRGFDDNRLIHVRVPHSRHPEPWPGLLIRRTRTLESRSWCERAEYPTMNAERAIFAIADHWPWRAHAVLSMSVQQGLTTAERLRGCLLGLGPVKGRAALSTSEPGPLLTAGTVTNGPSPRGVRPGAASRVGFWPRGAGDAARAPRHPGRRSSDRARRWRVAWASRP